MAEPHQIDAGLAALLRNDGAAAAPLLAMGADRAVQVAQRIDYHGVGHLLATSKAPGFPLPDWLAVHLREAAMGTEYWEATHQRAILPLADALLEADVTPVLMKGTALAYSLYDQPANRTRGDTDLLVHHTALKRTRAALEACGFQRTQLLHGQVAQEAWFTRTGTGAEHSVDLHWQVNDSPLLQRVLPLEAALANTRPLDQLAPGVRALSLAESFILLALNAAWHRTFGYRIGDERIAGAARLIWSCDTDLLLRAMDDGDVAMLLRRAHDTGVAPALHGAVLDAREQLQVPVDADLLDELGKPPARFVVMDYLQSESRIDRLKADFAASPGLRGKAAFAARMLLPTGRQLRQRYPAAAKWPLPALYLRHAAENAVKLLRHKSA